MRILLILISLCIITPSMTVGTFSTFPAANKFVLKKNRLDMSFLFEGDDIHILLEKTGAGFAAFGLGATMGDADIFKIETTGGALTVTDCKLIGWSAPVCDGDTNEWTTVASEITPTSFKIELKRAAKALTAQSGFDKTWSKNLLWVIFSLTPSETLVKHRNSGDYGKLQLDFSNGEIFKVVKTGSSFSALSKITFFMGLIAVSLLG